MYLNRDARLVFINSQILIKKIYTIQNLQIRPIQGGLYTELAIVYLNFEKL